MTAYAKGNILSSVHCSDSQVHGGDSVTVWRRFARGRIGKLHILDRIMDRFYYREILGRNLLPSIANFGFSGGFTFRHDNDPKHTSALVKDWLIKQNMKILSWSSYFPDLNPVEHLWDELERRLKKCQPKNRQELGNLLMEQWKKTEISVFDKLADSISMNVFVSKAIPLSTKLIICCSLHHLTNIFCKVGE